MKTIFRPTPRMLVRLFKFNPKMVRWVALLMVFALVMTSFVDESDARRRRKKRSNRIKKPVINEPKLYERIGGMKVVSEIVDDWLRLSFSDSRTSAEFVTVTSQPERIAKLRKELNDRICEFSDGPCPARAVDPAKAPEGMKAEEKVFLAHAENLLTAMQNRGLAEREKNEMMSRLGEFRAEVLPELEEESAPAVAPEAASGAPKSPGT